MYSRILDLAGLHQIGNIWRCRGRFCRWCVCPHMTTLGVDGFAASMLDRMRTVFRWQVLPWNRSWNWIPRMSKARLYQVGVVPWMNAVDGYRGCVPAWHRIPACGPGMGSRHGIQAWGPGMGSGQGVLTRCPSMMSRHGVQAWGPGMGSRHLVQAWGPGMGSRHEVQTRECPETIVERLGMSGNVLQNCPNALGKQPVNV